MPDPRSRTHTWQDPTLGATAAQSLSGLDYLRAMAAGDLPSPPIFHTLAFTSIDVAPGQITFHFTPEEFHYNPIGSVHGGVLATLLDSASACAVHSLLPAGQGYTTLELKINYIRPVFTTSGPMHCTGTVINLGRRTALAEAKLYDAQQKLYAHCTQTCLIFDPKPPKP